MITNFETGGSERQFSVLAQNLHSNRFRVHPGCISRQGPFVEGFGDAPEFPLGETCTVGDRFKLDGD